ncbi:hypothetical protein EDD90_10521 [Streptomyces sp. Ag109_O5-1]|nr:hypothetical protein EDD90_10521 [Streptomyces sp. Ag109_O5-1]
MCVAPPTTLMGSQAAHKIRGANFPLLSGSQSWN